MTNHLVQSLWKLVQNNDNEVGDIALSTLTSLGVPVLEKNVILKELHSRTAKRFNIPLLQGIARLSNPPSISDILEFWLTPQKRSELKVDPSLAFTVLREIADANENDEKLQDYIWAESSKLVEQDPKALYWNFDIGHVVVECNSSEVIPAFLGWHGQHPQWFEKPDWALYLAQDRLEKCVRPNQLKGWEKIGDLVIFKLLRQSACNNTRDDSSYSTQEWLYKQSAWKTLLRAGHGDVLHWFDDAVANEDGRYIRQKIMEYLACFRIDPIPERVIEWITEPYDDPGTSDGREISYRMAAVRMARSTATETALEVLLRFGFRYKGKVITQSTDAVAEAASALIRQGKPSVVPRLVELFTTSSNDGQRLACANALEVIASFPENQQWLLPHIENLIPLVYDENRNEIERGVLLNAFGHMNEWIVPDSLLQDLVSWARKPDKWIGGGSLYILANHGKLSNYPELLQDVLGLESDGDYWRLASKEIPFEWAPHTIGLLYYTNPDAYWPAIVSLLAQHWPVAVQVIRWLKATHGKEGQPDILQQVVEALIRRVKELYTPAYGETEVIDALVKLSPETLIEYPWSAILDKWMPDLRVELANALGKVNTNKNNKRVCLSTLEILAEDSIYAVRRAAYRGIAKQSGSHLFGLCSSWLESPLLKLNIRTAEAYEWVENVILNDGQDGYEVLYQQCISHVEAKVRESARRSWEERRQRLWAIEYLHKMMDVSGKDNKEIISAWRYGDALGQIGDDECREALLDHVSTNLLPPNVRYWVKRIIADIESSWKKTTQKWPDPWADIHGAIERGDGKLVLEHNKEIEIHYSTWQSPAPTPGEKHTWGGLIIASVEHYFNLEKAIIELEGGRRGNIIKTGFSGDTATFIGIGPFPTPKTQ